MRNGHPGRLRLTLSALVLAATAVVAGSGASAVSATVVPAAATAEAWSLPTPQEIQAQFDGWNADLRSGDPARLAARYAPDAVLLPTLSNEVRTTPEGVEDYFAEFMEKKPSGEILESHVIVQSDHSAVDAGTYRFGYGDGSHTDARYTFVYEKRDGQWMIITHHSSKMPQD